MLSYNMWVIIFIRTDYELDEKIYMKSVFYSTFLSLSIIIIGQNISWYTWKNAGANVLDQ